MIPSYNPKYTLNDIPLVEACAVVEAFFKVLTHRAEVSITETPTIEKILGWRIKPSEDTVFVNKARTMFTYYQFISKGGGFSLVNLYRRTGGGLDMHIYQSKEPETIGIFLSPDTIVEGLLETFSDFYSIVTDSTTNNSKIFPQSDVIEILFTQLLRSADVSWITDSRKTKQQYRDTVADLPPGLVSLGEFEMIMYTDPDFLTRTLLLNDPGNGPMMVQLAKNAFGALSLSHYCTETNVFAEQHNQEAIVKFFKSIFDPKKRT